MIRHAWLGLSALAWAGMTFLLFRREIQPRLEYQRPPSYRSQLASLIQPELERRGIFLGNERVGDVEALSEPLDGGGYRVRTRLSLKMKAFITAPLPEDRLHFSSDVRVDSAFQLADLRMSGRFVVPFNLNAERQGDRLRVSYNVIEMLKGDRLIEFPRDEVLGDSFLPYQGGSKLEVGKKWRMRSLDPMSLMTSGQSEGVKFQDLFAAVVDREAVTVLGREAVAFRVEVRKDPTQEFWDFTLWVDDEGRLLRQHNRMPNKLICEFVLESRKNLSAEEARLHRWTVEGPR
jgi:hypothetical protein